MKTLKEQMIPSQQNNLKISDELSRLIAQKKSLEKDLNDTIKFKKSSYSIGHKEETENKLLNLEKKIKDLDVKISSQITKDKVNPKIIGQYISSPKIETTNNDSSKKLKFGGGDFGGGGAGSSYGDSSKQSDSILNKTDSIKKDINLPKLSNIDDRIKQGSSKDNVNKPHYVICQDFPFKYGCKNDLIKEIQKYLGLPEKLQTGNFGPNTYKALVKNGYKINNGITANIYNEIRNKFADYSVISTSDVDTYPHLSNLGAGINERKSIKLIVRESLINERKNYIQESFQSLKNIKDDDYFLKKYALTTSKLISEGYSFNEIINTKLNENTEEFSEAFGFGSLSGLGDMLKGKDGGDYLSMLGGTVGNIVVERIIRWMLTTLGAGKDLAAFVSPILARYDVRDLLLPFKDKASCDAKMPSFMVAVMNGLVNYIQKGGEPLPLLTAKETYTTFGEKGIMPEAIRGIFSELFEQSNLDELLAEKMCNVIWK